MTTHGFHEDVRTHGLDPFCARCREYAEHPEREMDEEMIRRLLEGYTYTALDVDAADRLKRLMAQGLRLAAIVNGEDV